MKSNRISCNQIQTFLRISNNSIVSVLQAILVFSKKISKAHRGSLLAGRNHLHNMKNTQSPSNIQTFTQISNNRIINVLQVILVISNLWAKAHRGRLLAGCNKFHEMKNNRSSNRIQTFTRINNNSILSVLQPVMVLSKLLGKPQDRI